MNEGKDVAFDVAKLPQYKCHKVVRAAKIITMPPLVADEATIDDIGLAGGVIVKETQHWRRNHKAAIGGYYVVDEDGYASYSPSRAFEAGYKPLAEIEKAERKDRNDSMELRLALHAGHDEIERLRRRVEVLEAQVRVVEIFGNIADGLPHHGKNSGLREDPAWMLRRELARIDRAHNISDENEVNAEMSQ